MITLMPYNPAWPKIFSDEKDKIKNQLGDIIVEIEHIGSTAIPGIYAKPIIDILIGVRDLNKFSSVDINKIKSLGYHYIQNFEQVLPDRRYFQKEDSSGNRTHQIHLVNYQSAWWKRHLLFRDYLRKFPEQAKNYEKHKLELAKNFDDTQQYAIAKTEFCRTIDKKAYFDFEIHQPIVTTQRLLGYIPQEACYEVYSEMFQDADFIQCFGVSLSNQQIKDMLIAEITHWDHNGWGRLVWLTQDTHDFVGRGGLNYSQPEEKIEVELAYAINKKHWGNHFVVEFSQYAIDYGFQQLKLDNIVCFTMPTNYQSLRVIEKLGFQYEKDFIYKNIPHKLFRLRK